MFTPQVNTLLMTKGMECLVRKRIKKLASHFLMLDWEKKKERNWSGSFQNKFDFSLPKIFSEEFLSIFSYHFSLVHFL